jgi:GT2 family glycosyltransferase
VRQYAGPQHEIIVLDDASVDGTVDWLKSLSDDNLVIWENTGGKRLGHTITYNIGAELAKNDIFCILHADMFIGPNYVENALQHLSRKKVVSATRIEPPLHPEGKEKIVRDFGMWPETFKEKEFLQFVEEEQLRMRGVVTRGIFAPWFMYREDFLAIGGHDKLFAPFPYEDSDIFQRFILADYEIVQSRSSLVYHLTCRGHKWTDDTVIGKVDNTFAEAEVNARKNYLRKWNSWILNDEYHAPVMPAKYDTCAIIRGINEVGLRELEPWFGKVIIEDSELATRYIEAEQVNTLFNMSDRVEASETFDLTTHDVYVIIDTSRFGQDDFNTITQLSSILEDLSKSESYEGDYEIGNIKVKVNRLNNIVNALTVNRKY